MSWALKAGEGIDLREDSDDLLIDESIIRTAAYRRDAELTLAQADTWEDFAFDATETETHGFTRTGAEIKLDTPGIIAVFSDLQLVYTDGGNPDLVAAARFVKSTDGGSTFTEAPNLKGIFSSNQGAGIAATLYVVGNLTTHEGDIFKMQVQVSDTNFVFRADSRFDNPTAGELSMNFITRPE